MFKIFNFRNCKDQNYILLIISIALCFSSFQTVLTPSLDYIALGIKNNDHSFYNYALIGSLAATIPQASSLIAGYFVNNVRYKYLIKFICGLIASLSIIVFIHYQNFLEYAVFVIFGGILFNSLVCAVDRQIVILLADKIRDFQNDLFMLGTILAIVNYKMSNYLFSHYGIHGIIIYCILLNFIIFMCLNAIPAVDMIFSDKSHKTHLPNIRVLFKILLKHRKLITFIGLMLSIMFISSGLTLLFTTKIHHENLPTSLWSSNMAFFAFGGLLGAIICKTRFFQNANAILIISIGVVLWGTCLIGISNARSVHYIISILWFCGFLNAFIIINMNTTTFKYISKHSELVTISPVVNGLLTSAFYIVCLICPMILSPLLQIGISYKVILIACGILEIMFALTLISIKGLRTEFP